MCYRDPIPVDFTGLHVACLSGNNGHGKSALLDAITWALWGKARTNQADELIHQGQNDMWVEFEFSLGTNRYRVRRSRERRGRGGKSDLQLQIWRPNDTDSGEYRPITEPTIRDTERRIVELLRMDYDTFINSAFLVQGRADEFTVKPPGQRKQILSDILGLSIYDDYEARAKEQVRRERQAATRIEAQVDAIDEELAREPQYQADLLAAQEQIETLGQELAEAEKVLRSLQARRQELAAQQQSLQDLSERIKRGRRDLAELAGQLELTIARLAADENLLKDRESVENGYRQLVALQSANKSWNKKLGQQAELQNRRSRFEQEINQKRSQLEAELQIAQSQADRLQLLSDRQPALLSQMAEAKAELDRLFILAEQESQLQNQIQGLAEQKAAVDTSNRRLQAEMDEIKEKLTLLSEAGAACPVCDQPLGEEERIQVQERYQSQGKELGDQYRANQARLKEITQQGQKAKRAIQEARQELGQRSRWERQSAQIEGQLTEAVKAADELRLARATTEGLQAQLTSTTYAADAQGALQQIDLQLTDLAYDATAHEQVREDLLRYEPFQERFQQLQAALSRHEDLEERQAWLEKNQNTRQQALADDEVRAAQLQAALAQMPQLEKDLAVQSAQVEQLETAERRARQQLGAAQQRLDACLAQWSQRHKLTEELQTIRDRQAIYEDLQAAFGKNGLQAMIIEAAIPEIESEANRLLNNMTDGRMSVRLETQRETKTTQELRETLDIIISDELGSRDYSMYSGGEAFRTNFAVRIALSKLLARRAGARLQTLIIDEGFGTQDAQGRERLVQAINSIQDDFERVLVITHIEELKDHFPARIEVVKNDEGSQITIQ
jgi:exonuclease SbcC